MEFSRFDRNDGGPGRLVRRGIAADLKSIYS